MKRAIEFPSEQQCKEKESTAILVGVNLKLYYNNDMFLLGTSRQWLSWLSEQFLCCLPFHPLTVVLIVHLKDLQIVLHQLVLKQKPSLKCGPRSHFINLHPALGKMFNIEHKCLICMIHLDMYESRRTVHRLIINLDKMLSVIPRLWSFQESKCCFVQKKI